MVRGNKARQYIDIWWLRELGYESRTEMHVYEGIPVFNKIWRGLFGMAFVGEIRCG